MVKVKKNSRVFLNGHSSQLLEGAKYKEDSKVVIENPNLFEKVEEEIITEVPQVKEVVKEEVKEEELLVEEPVSILEITEVEKEVEEKPKRRRRSKKD